MLGGFHFTLSHRYRNGRIPSGKATVILVKQHIWHSHLLHHTLKETELPAAGAKDSCYYCSRGQAPGSPAWQLIGLLKAQTLVILRLV